MTQWRPIAIPATPPVDPRTRPQPPDPMRAGRGCARMHGENHQMTSQDTVAANAPAAADATPAATAPPVSPTPPAVEPDDTVPPPPSAAMNTAIAELTDADADVSTWITKEAGNRRIPYDRARLERSIDRTHAEFPQLDIADYKRSVFGFVERKEAVNADDLTDHLIREAEARVDVTAPEWEFFAARLYLHRLYKRASRNRFYDA